MGSPNPGRTVAASTARARCVRFVAQELRRAIATTDASLTVPEGLYRAYSHQLCDLKGLDGIPRSLQSAIDDLLADLRGAFGLDESTGAKVSPSRLDDPQATQLRARLEKVAGLADAMRDGDGDWRSL
jgi:hypothetical protein